MSGWDPAKYLEFSTPRLRPALDLLARMPVVTPASVYDLGCGTGHITRLLAERWPTAGVAGIDASAAMLAEAARTQSRVAWLRADLSDWAPPAPADVVFSNAALHWLDDHPALFRRLLGMLAPWGVLAVQMPRNHEAPSHALLAETALAGPWRDHLRPHLRPRPVAAPEAYYDLLAPHTRRLDIWETEYLHALEGEAPVVEWTKGSALKPLLDVLAEPDRSAFLAEYTARIRDAYPRRPDGRTLFPFRRLFLVAQR